MNAVGNLRNRTLEAVQCSLDGVEDGNMNENNIREFDRILDVLQKYWDTIENI